MPALFRRSHINGWTISVCSNATTIETYISIVLNFLNGANWTTARQITTERSWQKCDVPENGCLCSLAEAFRLLEFFRNAASQKKMYHQDTATASLSKSKHSYVKVLNATKASASSITCKSWSTTSVLHSHRVSEAHSIHSAAQYARWDVRIEPELVWFRY